MMTLFKKYRLVAVVLALYLVLALVRPDLAQVSTLTSLRFLGNVAILLPTILVLMGLFDVWVPRKVVERNMGPSSGLRGMLLAILLGTASAGPIFAAYPIALSLQRMGARMANISIFLGAWAAIKIPMILLESQFVGGRFALVRLALTLPGIIGMGLLMERLVPDGPP